MTDIGLTIEPKSNQLNADDLISGPRTIRVTRVSASLESKEQPVSVYYEGDNGKPWMPCKSMRRVLVTLWGRDGNSYVGKSVTLYRDPSVKFGGAEVGGIRISHASDIDKPVTMALTVSRANRKPYTVHPLQVETKDRVETDPITEYGKELAVRLKEWGAQEFYEWWNDTEEYRASLNIPEDRAKKMNDAAQVKIDELGNDDGE